MAKEGIATHTSGRFTDKAEGANHSTLMKPNSDLIDGLMRLIALDRDTESNCNE